ncbi:hypothetical protein SVIO_002540 [Streptomyces violaceusniger]|uniref:Uncharacterized protein n=1 Tax=Streptomyces violaceusniger TaxID=68280 RepID=A0A4D4KKF4_STRVO|nr:hypothetical protein SVIO_002540 [Streptomyces violaceusniger]
MACQGSTDVRRYDQTGRFRGVLRTGARGEVIGLRTGPERTVWLLTDDGGRLTIHRGGHRRHFDTVTMDELAAALPPSALTSADDDGFCLSEQGPDGPRTTCYTWRGRPRDPAPPATDAYLTSGSYVTALIDSGISRCRWHRVRVDADVPDGTAVAVQIVVTEDSHYDDSDWQASAPGSTDFLVDQPPGRYLRLRLRLSGDGAATPVVRRIRLDFPGSPAPICCRPPSARTPRPTTSPNASCRCSTPRSPSSTGSSSGIRPSSTRPVSPTGYCRGSPGCWACRTRRAGTPAPGASCWPPPRSCTGAGARRGRCGRRCASYSG